MQCDVTNHEPFHRSLLLYRAALEKRRSQVKCSGRRQVATRGRLEEAAHGRDHAEDGLVLLDSCVSVHNNRRHCRREDEMIAN